MKRLGKILLVAIVLETILSFTSICVANSANSSSKEMIQEQQEEFGIQDFLKSSKEYSGEIFDDIDMSEVLNDAINGKIDNAKIGKKILNLLGSEVVTSIKAIGSILVIIIIHSVLKSISESLEDKGVSKLIYYVQYILIITIIMANFSDIVKMVQDTTTNLVAFMNMLIPLLITLMLSTGSIVTSGVIQPIILFMINFIGNIIQNIIIPFIMIYISLVIISKLSEQVKIDKFTKFLKSSFLSYPLFFS